MLIGVVVAVGVVCQMLYRADQDSRKDRAEMHGPHFDECLWPIPRSLPLSIHRS
jgi:hypothetical protein